MDKLFLVTTTSVTLISTELDLDLGFVVDSSTRLLLVFDSTDIDGELVLESLPVPDPQLLTILLSFSGESVPIALHVLASIARGLALAST